MSLVFFFSERCKRHQSLPFTPMARFCLFQILLRWPARLLTNVADSVIVTGLVKIILGYVPGQRNPSFARTEVWTVVHAGTAIICASLPIFRPSTLR